MVAQDAHDFLGGLLTTLVRLPDLCAGIDLRTLHLRLGQAAYFA